MKKNSRILSLTLAGSAIENSGAPLSVLLQLPIGETTAGKRSLVYFLAKEGQVWIEKHQGIIRVGLTGQGRRKLQAQFPALLVSLPLAAPEWQLLLLKQAPKSDPHFRSLAVLCEKYRVLRLMRGAYAYPGALPAGLEIQLQTLYAEEHIARCTVKEWMFGLDRPIIVSYYDIEHLSAIYSSISKELDQLLSDEYRNKYSIDQPISIISSIISRLESALTSDCGLVQVFFPKTPISSDLVNAVGKAMAFTNYPNNYRIA